jgi:hypothetical protein
VALNLRESTHFSTEREMRITNQLVVLLCITIISAVKRVEFVSDRMSYIVLRNR